jgi:hypothetical protein
MYHRDEGVHLLMYFQILNPQGVTLGNYWKGLFELYALRATRWISTLLPCRACSNTPVCILLPQTLFWRIKVLMYYTRHLFDPFDDSEDDESTKDGNFDFKSDEHPCFNPVPPILRCSTYGANILAKISRQLTCNINIVFSLTFAWHRFSRTCLRWVPLSCRKTGGIYPNNTLYWNQKLW